MKMRVSNLKAEFVHAIIDNLEMFAEDLEDGESMPGYKGQLIDDLYELLELLGSNEVGGEGDKLQSVIMDAKQNIKLYGAYEVESMLQGRREYFKVMGIRNILIPPGQSCTVDLIGKIITEKDDEQ